MCQAMSSLRTRLASPTRGVGWTSFRGLARHYSDTHRDCQAYVGIAMPAAGINHAPQHRGCHPEQRGAARRAHQAARRSYIGAARIIREWNGPHKPSRLPAQLREYGEVGWGAQKMCRRIVSLQLADGLRGADRQAALDDDPPGGDNGQGPLPHPRGTSGRFRCEMTKGDMSGCREGSIFQWAFDRTHDPTEVHRQLPKLLGDLLRGALPMKCFEAVRKVGSQTREESFRPFVRLDRSAAAVREFIPRRR
jgi:hypothetical protein